jgi:ABC-type multidrug transport system fused ATPase/permease subunit
MIRIIKDFFFLIPSKNKFLICCSVIFLSGVLETLGISLIIPFFDLISEKKNINFYTEFLLIVSNYTKQDYIFIVFIILIFYYFIRAAYLALAAYIQYNYICKIQISVSNKLYTQYVKQPYEYHLNSNSSVAIRDLTSDINYFTNLLVNIFSFFNDIFFIILIFGFLFFLYSYEITFIFILLLIFGFFFIKIIKTFNFKWGEIRSLTEQIKIKIIQQGLGAIKEIKFSNKENFFLKIFFNSQKMASSIQLKQNFFQSLPRIILEFFGLFFFFSYIFFNLKIYDVSFIDTIPRIAVLLVVLIRILPSLSRILSSMQNIYFYSSCLDNLNRFRASIDKNTANLRPLNKKIKKFNLFNSIYFKNLTFSYSCSNKFILKNFTNKIIKNKLTVIYGPSGSGKSTLINLLTGIFRPQKGGIYLGGKKNIFDDDSLLMYWQSIIGYVSQNIFILDDTVIKNIAFGIPDNKIDVKKIKKMIKIVKLDQFVSESKYGLNTLIGENGIKLSGGQKQRIAIARALYKNPKILILDEATNSIDSKTESIIVDNLRSINLIKYIIIVSHKKEIIKKCDYAINIK